MPCWTQGQGKDGAALALGDGASWGRGWSPRLGPWTSGDSGLESLGGGARAHSTGPLFLSQDTPEAGTSRGQRGGKAWTSAHGGWSRPHPSNAQVQRNLQGFFNPQERWGALPTGLPRTTSSGCT